MNGPIDGDEEFPSVQQTGQGAPTSRGEEVDAEPAGVSRAGVRDARDAARRKKIAMWVGGGIAAAVVLGVGVFMLVGSGGDDRPVVTTTTTTTTSTTTTTAVPPHLATTVMPLTGIPVNGDDPATAAKLAGAALAVKIDNDPRAQPHVGIGDADIVIELRVEGISRLMAVFHSRIPEQVGPVRSARTSDPDLLAMFGKPVFAWSGGNKNVMKVIRDTPWVVDAAHGTRAVGYSRAKGRRAPHNLMLAARELMDSVGDRGLPPHELFTYRGADEVAPGEPTSGFNLRVGSSPVSFRWDATTSKWVRHGRSGPEEAADGSPVVASNVIVAQTGYRPSSADRRSPEAESVGGGRLWVFTEGKVVTGLWTRENREVGWNLVDASGNVIALTPGNTWVELPDRDVEPNLVD